MFSGYTYFRQTVYVYYVKRSSRHYNNNTVYKSCCAARKRGSRRSARALVVLWLSFGTAKTPSGLYDGGGGGGGIHARRVTVPAPRNSGRADGRAGTADGRTERRAYDNENSG